MSLYYTDQHEWINTDNPQATTVGITEHAQEALGDVVFVELPEIGQKFSIGAVAGVVESVKAAADVYMPISGQVVEVNEALRSDPSLANTAPLSAGWFFKVKASAPAEFEGLMNAAAYGDLVKKI
jgi:glycine cleavage system H protein